MNPGITGNERLLTLIISYKKTNRCKYITIHTYNNKQLLIFAQYRLGESKEKQVPNVKNDYDYITVTALKIKKNLYEAGVGQLQLNSNITAKSSTILKLKAILECPQSVIREV